MFFCKKSFLPLLLTAALLFVPAGCSDDDTGGAGSDSSLASSSAASSTGGDTPLTVVSYNVENFDASGSYSTIANYVKNNSVDVIVLLEVQSPGQDGDTTGDETPFASALNSAGYTMQYHQFLDADGWNSIGFFSRYPVSGVTTVVDGTYTDPVSGNSKEAVRPIVKFQITAENNTPVWFYGAHLRAKDTGLEERRAQAHALEEYIKNNHDMTTDRIVVCGDLNTTEDYGSNNDFDDDGTLGYLSLKSDNPGNTANDFTAVNYTFIPTDYTYPSYSSLLDHILLSPAAYSGYVNGSVDVSDVYASDHKPVILTFNY